MTRVPLAFLGALTLACGAVSEPGPEHATIDAPRDHASAPSSVDLAALAEVRLAFDDYQLATALEAYATFRPTEIGSTSRRRGHLCPLPAIA